MKVYFCVGCRQVHFDNDYMEEDGDLEISNWYEFLESAEKVKKELERSEK